MFFKNYPQTLYNFGNETSATAFQNISGYVDVIDQVKNNINFYQYLTVQDGERPDTLSQQIYGSVKYYWMFYLLNDDIRELGWPLTTQRVVLKAQNNYTKTVLTTRDIDSLLTHFQEGDSIIGQTSGATGTVTKRDLNFGQIFITKTNTLNFLNSELIRDNTDPEFPESLELVSVVEEYNAVHHYENSDGEYVDVDPYSAPSALLTPITYLDRFQQVNDQLREIKIIKPSSVQEVYSAYQQALRTI
jgi:hypothetical protein